MRFSKLIDIERELSTYNKNLYAKYYDLPIGLISDDTVAVVGVDGWQFIGNGSNQWEMQFLGLIKLTEKDLATWQHTFENRKRAAESIGAIFKHFVIPEKQSVYPCLRWPENNSFYLNERPIVQLREVIDDGLIYPLEDLQAESWSAELFHRGNSHWCASAAWIGFCKLMKSVWPEKFFDFSVVPLARNYLRHDLLVKFTSNVCYEQVVCIPRRSKVIYNNNLLTNTGGHVGNHYILFNEKAPFPETIVIYGDSYSYDVGFSDLMSAFFLRVHFIWGTSIDFEYCKKMDANLIVVENSERFMMRMQNADLFIK